MAAVYDGPAADFKVRLCLSHRLHLPAALCAPQRVRPAGCGAVRDRAADLPRGPELHGLDHCRDFQPVHRIRHLSQPAVSQDRGQRGGFGAGHLHGHGQPVHPASGNPREKGRLSETERKNRRSAGFFVARFWEIW